MKTQNKKHTHKYNNTKIIKKDNTQLKLLLEQVSSECYSIDTIIGDGAHEAKDNYKLTAKFNASIIAPPQKNAWRHTALDISLARRYN